MVEALEGAVLAGQFRVEELSEEGGMADVYRATDLRHGRRVAVKVLRRNPAFGATDERFQREIEIASRLSHPHVLPLFQSGRHGGYFYLVMPFVEGDTLERRLGAESPMPIGEAIRIVAEIADGVHYAHAEGVVHRDIKPSNIFLIRDHAVLADFGVAKSLGPRRIDGITQSGASIGTPLYMSPEQALGGIVDERTDVYSLGCILYEALTGEVPHGAGTPIATYTKRRTEPAPSPRALRSEISARLDATVRRALEPSLEARFSSAAELRAELIECLHEVRQGGTAATRGRSHAVRRAVGGALVLVAVALSAGAVIVLGRGSEAEPIRTLVVLPFVPVDEDGDDGAYLAEGVAQDLRDQLSRREGLRVASRESSVAAGGSETSAAAAAERLDAEGFVEGSISRRADSLRIEVSLTDTRTGRPQWAGNVAGRPEEIFDLQNEIVDSLARILGFGDRTVGSDPRVTATTDVATHNLYLQGRYAAADRTSGALDRARRLFHSAIERDSAYAPAWAALASTLTLRGVYEYDRWAALRPEAEFAAAEAMRLDPTLSEAYTAWGVLLDYSFRWAEAEAAYVRAIELNPNDAQAHHWYAVSRVLAGEPHRAPALIERARDLDPLSFTIAVAAGWVHFYRRDLVTALERLEGALALEPNAWVAHQYLGFVYADLGRFDDALWALRTARDLNPSALSLLPGLARVHAMRGDTARARELLDEARVAGTPMSWMAIGHLAVGESEEAITWLERARDAGPWNVIEINTFWFEGLRDHRRYEALVADVRPTTG